MDSQLKKAIKEFLKFGSVEQMQDLASVDVLNKKGMVVPSERLSHDELISRLFEEVKGAIKHEVIESFLYGLEHGAAQCRAALSAFAITLNFPQHSFDSPKGVQCEICSGFKSKCMNYTLYDVMRHISGATNGGPPEQLYFFLKKHNELRAHKSSSVSVLNHILDVIRSAEDEETPVTLEKKIRAIPGVTFTKEESRSLLDLLGHLSILETTEHKGFLSEFKNIGRMPRKSRSSDWSYPVDFWIGKDGVNEDAVIFWFGDYIK